MTNPKNRDSRAEHIIEMLNDRVVEMYQQIRAFKVAQIIKLMSFYDGDVSVFFPKRGWLRIGIVDSGKDITLFNVFNNNEEYFVGKDDLDQIIDFLCQGDVFALNGDRAPFIADDDRVYDKLSELPLIESIDYLP